MNFKLAWILLALLLLVVGGLLVASLLDDAPPLGQVLLVPLANVKEADVDTVELVRSEPGEERIVFTRSGKDQWDITEPGRGKADKFAVKKLVADLLALKPTASKEVTENKTVHGLDKPGLRVTLKSGSKAATLNVGDTTIGRNPVTFVSTDARTVPVAVLRSDIDGLFRTGTADGKAWQNAKWLADYRQRAFFRGENDLLTETESLAFFKGGKETKLVRNPGTGDWTFAAPAGYGLADLAGDPQAPPGVFTGVRPLVNALTALQAQGAEDYIEKPEPLDKYGLAPTDKDVLRIEVKPKDGPADVVYVGKRVDDKTDKFYCKLANDTSVVKVSAVPERVAALAKVALDPSDLRDRTLIPDTKQLTIDAIDIVLGPATTKLRRIPTAAESRWALYGGPTDPQFAGIAVQELLTALAKPRIAKEVLPAPYDAVFADAERKVELRFWYEGAERPAPTGDPTKLPPEPKLKGDGKPSLTVLFGKKEADFVYVRRTTADGIRTDMKLPESVLPVVLKDRLAYLDPKLKPFPNVPPKKLTLVRGGETIVVEGDGKGTPDSWKFTAPDRLKGQVADAGKVGEFVGMVAIMTPSRVAAENPADADLAKYGVGPTARVKMTIAFEDKEPERTYEFGNEAEDKASVYLRTNVRPAVVVVSRLFADRLGTEDLRDRRLYEIDKAKVKAITLNGWKAALKQPTKYRLERAGDKWVVKEPAGEKGAIDPAKVEIFLAALAAPRASNYVPGGFKPEQGFDVANAANSLEVNLEIEGHPGLAFNFANETDGGTNYFAWTSAKKDDVFTISTNVLREFKENPRAFFK